MLDNNNSNSGNLKEPTVILKEPYLNKEEKAEDETESIKSINSNKDGCVFNKNITLVRLDPKKN